MHFLPLHEFALILMLVITAAYRPAAALAQNPDPSASSHLAQNLLDGLDALSRGEVEIADDILNSLIQIDPGYHSPEHGSAAFWWGEALARRGNEEAAHRAWSAGIGALERISVFDARLVDRYITSVAGGERRQEFPRAMQLYHHLITKADEEISRTDRCVVIKRVAQVFPLLSRAEQRRISDGDKRTRCDNFTAKPGAAAFLRTWWASQDPYLSSARNERLQEHLDRTGFAEANFPAGDRVLGVDERGEIYIRFGPPSRVVTLGDVENRFPQSHTTLGQPTNDQPPQAQDSETTDQLTSGEAFVVPAAGLPTGQLWLYDHISSSGYYFFVKEGRRYRLGEVTDLVPLQHRNFSGFRGQQNANLAASILFGRQGRNGAYTQLAQVHPDFASRYTAYETYSNSGRQVPPMHRLWAELRADEMLSSAAREKQMPNHFSAHAREHCPLPINYRLARFLDGDRNTVTKIYWQHDGSSSIEENVRACTSAPLESAAEEEYLLRLTSAQTAYGLEARDVKVRKYVIPGTSELLKSSVFADSLSPVSDSVRLALQWDAFSVPRGSIGERLQPEDRVSVTTIDVDSVAPLAPDPLVLEMSDIVPIRFSEVDVKSELDSRDHIHPLLSGTVTPQDSFGVFFEVYNLHYANDDLTRYTIEYEILHTRTGSILRLFRPLHRSLAARTSYVDEATSVRHTIELALDDAHVPSQLGIRVRVTDDTSGQEVSKRIDLELRHPD